VCSVLANVMGSGKKKFAPSDFLPSHKPSAPSKPQSVARGMAAMSAFGPFVPPKPKPVQANEMK
jgi:hypothetical protein